MNNMNMNSNSFVTPPEHIVHEHGSSNQVNINNNILPSRSNPTRTIPVDFTSEQQGGQPTKRRKSSAAFVMPPHQPDPFMQSQAQYYVQPQPQSQPVYVPYPQSFQMRQPMSMSSSRNTNANSRSSRVMGYPDNINTQVVLQNPDQIMSSQNNQHVQSQMVSPPIGFTSQMNQIQLSNQQQQQQQQQQQLSQQLLHGNNQGQMQQINLNMDLYRSSQIGNVFYPSMQQAELYLGDLSTPTPTPTHTPLPTPTPMLSQDYILQRLDTIKSEITKKDYQTLCAELLKYLQTDIAYSSPQCQESFYQCLQNIKSNFGSTPMEIGLSVFQAALNNIHRFSNTQHQNHIKKWANELNKSSSVTSQQFPANNINPSLVRPVARQQQQQQQPPPPPPQQQQHHQQQINQPRIENKQISDVEKANGNWVSRIIDRAWGHVMLPYESLIANQHQEQQEFVNSFYIPHEKFERIWKLETASPATLIHPNKLPLTYRLISRKPNNIDDDNKCDWPPEEAMFKVQINDSEVKLHRKQRIPIKNNQYSFVGVDKAVDIAQYLEAGVNRIKITQCMCETCRQQLCEHILSIEILLKETEEIVLRNARSQTLTVEHGMEIVKRLISGPSASIINAQSPTSSISSPSHTMITDEDDCDVTVNKMKVSLRCPISLLRIAEPAKGQHCLHIGCFDLETYVSVNKKNSKWRCPECNDRVTSETLRIDEYFKRLLEQIPENVNTVELDSSGRWTVVGQDDCDGESTDDDDMQVDSASKKSSISSQKAPNTIIILDDDDDDELEPQPINNQQQVFSMQNNNMPTYDQSSTIIRQTSTPYTQPVRNDQSQLTNSIIIQSPPHSASLTTPSIPKNYLPQLPLSQLSADHTTYVEAIPPFYNNSNKSKRKSNSKKRRSRRKDMEVNTQDRGNSSTKDDHNNNEDNSNSKSNWLQVAGIQTLLLSPQDSVTKTATQVASPISPPISVTVPNHSQSEEWETEDEQEEVVLVSSTTV